MRRTKFLLVAAGGLLLGFLAGRLPPRPGDPSVDASAPETRRQPDRAAPGTTDSRASYADLERRFATLSGARRSTAINGAVGRMDLAKIKELLAETGGRRASMYYSYGDPNLRQALFERWAELDPESLITHAMAQQTMERFEGLGFAFGALAAQDYDAANARLQQLGPDVRDGVKFNMLKALVARDPERAFSTAVNSDDPGMKDYLPMALSKWAVSDPARAMAAFAAMPPGRSRQTCLMVMGGTLASNDPDAAVAWAGQLGNAMEQSNAMKTILQSIAYSDPIKALALLDKNPEAKSAADGDSMLSSIFSSLARLDFNRAQEEILKLKDPASRVKALAALASSSKQNHGEELLALAATLPAAEAKALYLGDYWGYSNDTAKTEAFLEQIPAGPLRQQAKLSALNALAYRDPEAAARQLATVQPTMLSYSWPIGEIAGSWAQQDPAKALAWANQLESFDQKKQALSRIYATLTTADPAAAAARLDEITDPKLRTEITSTVVGQWATADPNKALAWSHALPAEDRNAAMRQIAASQIDGNPTLARQIFDQMIQQFSPAEWNQSETRQTAGRMASELAETDPQAAAKFAETLPAGGAQEEAYAKVIGAWSRYAPAEAETWLAQMPAGGIRDQAASTFAATMAASDPAKAYEWAVSITDPTLRRQAAVRSLQAWKANGQIDQARSALQQAGVFSEQELTELGKAIE